MTTIRIISILFLVVLSGHLGVGIGGAVELPNEDCRPGSDVEAFTYNGRIAVAASDFGGKAQLLEYYDDQGLQELFAAHSSGRIFVDNDNVVHITDNGTDYSRQIHPPDQVDGIFCDVYDGTVDGTNVAQDSQRPTPTPATYEYGVLFEECSSMMPEAKADAVAYLESTAGEMEYGVDDLETTTTDSGGLAVMTKDGSAIFNGSSSVIFNCHRTQTQIQPQTPESVPQTPESRPEEITLQLTGQKTNVTVGQQAIMTFSGVNLVDNDPVTIQLIIQTPSGVSVRSVSNVETGSNQYAAVFSVKPGQSQDVRVTLDANQPGDYTVTGIAVYYFGNDTSETRRYSQSVSLNVQSNNTPTPNRTATETTGTDGVGFTLFSALLAIVVLHLTKIVSEE